MTQHITGSLNWFVDRISQLEQDVVSVERIHQYSKDDFAQEQQIKTDSVVVVDDQSQWPSAGRIEFKSVFMKYRDGLPDVLQGISFRVNGGEKIGIIGRTGAGKSSLFVSLLRLVEVERGHIYVDDLDIASVALQRLRSKISIIPQDPVLFSGDIRFNLDPFNATTMSLKDYLTKKECAHLHGKLQKMGVDTVNKLRECECSNDEMKRMQQEL